MKTRFDKKKTLLAKAAVLWGVINAHVKDAELLSDDTTSAVEVRPQVMVVPGLTGLCFLLSSIRLQHI